MDSHLRQFASRQADVIAAWQLRRAGWSLDRVRHHLTEGGWRRLHSGVYVLSSAPVTKRQLWFAATLTAPGSVLSHGSAGSCHGFYRFERPYEIITRTGQGGRQRRGRLLIFRSKTLTGNTTRRAGIPITTAERTLIDLAPGLDAKRLGRAFREAMRLERTTIRRVLRSLDSHPGRPGTPALGALARRYAEIPYARARSDAEARALEVLHDAGLPLPAVNVRVGGEEADFVWFERRLILEIDGPQYHRFRDEDARKAAIWREAGFEVRRASSAMPYDDPRGFVALVRQ
jgi:hypothetical protein